MVKFTSSEIFHPEVMDSERAVAMLRCMKRAFNKTYIRKWRKHRNLTLEQLASRVEMTPSHLSMLETGKRGYAQETLEAIAEALQTDAGSLLMRDPTDPEGIWSVWDNALPGQRRTIVEVAKTIVKTGTGN